MIQTLNDLLDDTAARKGRKTALVFPGGAMTFSDLRAGVLRAASGFGARGIGKGDRVAVLLRNSPEFIIAYFGLSRLGAAAVPINFMVQKADELAYMLADCSAKGAVTQEEFLRGLLEARKKLPGLKSVWACDTEDPSQGVEDFHKFLAGAPAGAPPDASVSGDDVAAILYTSGTTGSSKGVMLTHSNFVSNCEASIAALHPAESDVCLTLLPLFHTFSWTSCALVSLRMGLKNILVPSITPPAPWLKQMGRHRVTIFVAVPQIYAVLAKVATGFKRLILRYWFFRGVRLAVSGAAPLSRGVFGSFREVLGVRILEGYGLTETSPIVTVNPPGNRRWGSVGLPIKDVRLKIVMDDGSQAAAGEEGEVCVKGPNVMKGYLNRFEDTKAAFTADGWLKTGDIGVLDEDGYLHLHDRKKDMIIVKGLKVFSAQVEAALLEHPGIEEAAVIGVPDETGNETIKAFVVPRKDAAVDKAELLRHCRSKLDPYKRPRDIEIVESLPKNALQKVLKRVLRQQELDKRK